MAKFASTPNRYALGNNCAAPVLERRFLYLFLAQTSIEKEKEGEMHYDRGEARKLRHALTHMIVRVDDNGNTTLFADKMSREAADNRMTELGQGHQHKGHYEVLPYDPTKRSELIRERKILGTDAGF